MPLTETAVKNAKPRDEAYKLADSGGLYLLVTPIGSRLWDFKYRFDGREKLLSFGPHPVTGTKKARVKRDEAKALLIDGLDPSRVRRTARRMA
ncbi:MAG: Arm DNA-binding domain-containing protein [Pseudomonadota bacterium]